MGMIRKLWLSYIGDVQESCSFIVRTSRDVTCRVGTTVRSKPTGDGIDIDTIGAENTLLAHCACYGLG